MVIKSTSIAVRVFFNVATLSQFGEFIHVQNSFPVGEALGGVQDDVAVYLQPSR